MWEQRVRELGLVIGEPIPPVGNYAAIVIHGGLAHTSGIVALDGPPWHLAHPGRLGDDLSIDEGRAAAAGAMVAMLRNLRGALGSLDRIERFVKLVGYVRCTPEFDMLSAVLEGASGVLLDLFGAELLPARSAIGVLSLPGGASVELEAVVSVTS